MRLVSLDVDRIELKLLNIFREASLKSDAQWPLTGDGCKQNISHNDRPLAMGDFRLVKIQKILESVVIKPLLMLSSFEQKRLSVGQDS